MAVRKLAREPGGTVRAIGEPITPPTEAEIRAALLEQLPLPEDPAKILYVLDVPDWMVDTVRVLSDSDMASVRNVWHDGCYPPDDHPGTLWADLRTAEIDELHPAIEEVYRRILAESARRLVDEITAVGVAFAKAHPDIPRGHWKARGEAVQGAAIPTIAQPT